MLRGIKTTPPLHRFIAIGISRSLDEQKGLAQLDSNHASTLSICPNRSQTLFRANHPNPKIAFKKAIERTFTSPQAVQRQAVKQVGDQINLIKNHRLTTETQQALDMNHLITRMQTQNCRHLW